LLKLGLDFVSSVAPAEGGFGFHFFGKSSSSRNDSKFFILLSTFPSNLRKDLASKDAVFDLCFSLIFGC